MAKSKARRNKSTEAAAPSVDDKGTPLAQPPAPRGGAEPRATLIGIPLYNPAAAAMVTKVMNDIGEGKLDMSKHEDRMEMVHWTDLILKQEQIYGQTGYILRNITSRANFASLLAKLLGRVASEVGGQPRQEAVRADF